MARTLSVAAIQTSYGMDLQANIKKTEHFIREAASKGAQVILPSELFQGPYFCVAQEEKLVRRGPSVARAPGGESHCAAGR
jgi:N-carbamoylputrescine amidase